MKKNNLDLLNPTNQEISDLEATMEFCAENEEMEDAMEESIDNCSENGLRRFLNQIGQEPLLSATEEQELFRIYNEGGANAKAAREKLIKANLRLVVYIAKKYMNKYIELEDLISMGQLGLIKAIEKFDYTKGFKLSTYAIWWINQAIARGMDEENSLIRIPVHAGEMIRKLKKAQRELLQANGQEASVAEVAEYTGTTPENVLRAIQSMYTVVPMETPVGEDGDGTIEDLIKDENAIDPCENAIKGELRKTIREVINHLEPREALVLSLRYGIGNDRPMSLEEIAKLPNIRLTRERIRQIELRALERIRRRPSVMAKLKEFVA